MKKIIILYVVFFISNSVFYAQQAKLDSLQKVISKNDKDTNTVNALTTLSSLIRNTETDRAIELSKKAIILSNQLNYKKGNGLACLNLGTIQHIKGNYDSAFVYYTSALSFFNQIKYKKYIAKCYNNLGNLHQLKADYSKAIEQLLLCKKIGEELKNDKILSDCELNMGNVYLQKKEFNNAIIHYTSGLVIAKKMNDVSLVAQYLNNIGAAQRMLNKPNLALANYKESLAIRLQTNDAIGTAENILNIGDVYYTIATYDSALVYFINAYKQYSILGHKTGVAYSLNNLGGTLFKLHKHKEALDTLEKVVHLTTELGLRDLKVEAYKIMSEALYQMKCYKESAEYMGYLMALKDSLLNEESNKQITEMQTKYESEKKDKEIIKQTAEIKTQQIESEKKSAQRNVLVVGLALLFALALFIYRGYKQKQKANAIITIQKEEVENKNAIIEEKQKEIIDSINYAKRIQYTLLAHSDFLNANIPNHFVYFNPKDIVSGDFYWATKTENKFYLAVCDSTGHGVPGAFMSLLNIGFLSEAINEKGIEKPNEVFNYVRQRLIDNISKDGQKDGFDGILICIDLITKQITYAGANNKPILVSNQGLNELEFDRMPVGIGERKEDFKLYTINPKEGDIIYLYTDGYADQFGGSKGKKFKYKPLNELILANSRLTMEEQQDVLKRTFDCWRGNLEQVDDVCIVGIKA